VNPSPRRADSDPFRDFGRGLLSFAIEIVIVAGLGFVGLIVAVLALWLT
jgi:hypothetical protein